MSKKFFSLFAILVLVLILPGCGQKTAQEKMTEQILEQSAGGQADVDLSDNKAKIETEEGSMEFGENISLPADFPADVFVIDGRLNAAYYSAEQNSYTISLETNQSFTEVQSAYERELKNNGWRIVGTMSLGSGASLSAEKDNRAVSVVMNSNGASEPTGIVLSVTQK